MEIITLCSELLGVNDAAIWVVVRLTWPKFSEVYFFGWVWGKRFGGKNLRTRGGGGGVVGVIGETP
jgi:hypothetical protein